MWNVQIRGRFVCAETKGLGKWDFAGVVQVHILRELARIGVAAVINSDPRGLYHK